MMRQFLCGIMMAAMLSPAAGSARVLYVDQAVAVDAGDGSDWANAFRTLSEALDVAEASDGIWVARGAYRPADDNNRSASFVLVEGVGVHGGFAGHEAERSARAWRLNDTILSGSIGVPVYTMTAESTSPQDLVSRPAGRFEDCQMSNNRVSDGEADIDRGGYRLPS